MNLISFLRINRHAVTRVNDESNLQVINPAHLGQKVSGLSDRISIRTKMVRPLCSISGSLSYPLISLLLVQITGLKKKNLELEANPTN